MAAEHIEIFNYLLDGDASRAARTLKAHLQRSLTTNLGLLQMLDPLSPDQYPDYLVPEEAG